MEKDQQEVDGYQQKAREDHQEVKKDHQEVEGDHEGQAGNEQLQLSMRKTKTKKTITRFRVIVPKQNPCEGRKKYIYAALLMKADQTNGHRI